MLPISEEALAIAATGGYSEDNYRSWPAVAQSLLDEGYTAREAEAIMRSKWTRWAADYSGKPYGQNTAQDLLRFIADEIRDVKAEVASLVKGTFG